MSIDQEKMIVEALPSLYPLKDYEEDAIHAVIDALPPAQPEPLQPWEVLAAQAVLSHPAEPKRGKWIKYEQDFMLEGSLGTVQKTVRECSVCTAKIAGMVGIMNFCPNCGAKMEEKT